MTQQLQSRILWRGVVDPKRSATMKLSLLFGLMLVFFRPALAVDHNPVDFSHATTVDVWDERISDLHATPVSITESNEIVALAGAIQNAPGDWKRGSFTAPSGYLRFVFKRDSKVIAAIGLGEQFLVRGGESDWEFKKISRELEAKLAAFGQKKSPNKSLQATRDGRSSSAIAEDVINPACLSSGR
jgi:hypothetical protein